MSNRSNCTMMYIARGRFISLMLSLFALVHFLSVCRIFLSLFVLNLHVFVLNQAGELGQHIGDLWGY